MIIKVYHYLCTLKINNNIRINMGKISVKHYFNNRLKSESIKGNEYNPLYVQIVRKTKTHQVRSVFVTEKITKEQLQGDEIKKLCKHETEFILSFFEFAESAINDFSVSKSKTNLGKLFAFYNADIYEIMNDYGFVNYETRNGIKEKLRKYITDKTGFDTPLTWYVVKDIINDFDTFNYELRNVKTLHESDILTDKEAGKIEFEILTLQYIIDTNIKNNVHQLHQKLSLFNWFSNKNEILQYIEQKTQYSTKAEILEYAADTEKLLKCLFTDFYRIGIYKNLHKILINADNTLSVVENGKETHKPKFKAAKKWYE